MIGYIYAMYDNNENDVFYIGASIKPTRRLKEHIFINKEFIEPPNNGRPYYKTTNGKQLNYFIVDEIEFQKRKDLNKLEAYWIQQFKAWGFALTNRNCIPK